MVQPLRRPSLKRLEAIANLELPYGMLKHSNCWRPHMEDLIRVLRVMRSFDDATFLEQQMQSIPDQCELGIEQKFLTEIIYRLDYLERKKRTQFHDLSDVLFAEFRNCLRKANMWVTGRWRILPEEIKVCGQAARELMHKLEKRRELGLDELCDYANKNLKGKERRIVQLLCKDEGECPLADLAVKISWQEPYDNACNNARRRINKKLKAAKLSLQFSLIRQDNSLKVISRK